MSTAAKQVLHDVKDLDTAIGIIFVDVVVLCMDDTFLLVEDVIQSFEICHSLLQFVMCELLSTINRTSSFAFSSILGRPAYRICFV